MLCLPFMRARGQPTGHRILGICDCFLSSLTFPEQWAYIVWSCSGLALRSLNMSEVIRDIHWTAHKNSWDQWANTHPPGSTSSPPPKLTSYFINKPNFKTEQVPHLHFSANDLPEFMSAIGYPKQSSCHLDCIQIRLWIDVLAPIVTSALEHLSASRCNQSMFWKAPSPCWSSIPLENCISASSFMFKILENLSQFNYFPIRIWIWRVSVWI